MKRRHKGDPRPIAEVRTNWQDRFVRDLKKALGPWARSDKTGTRAQQIWNALANVNWHHLDDNGEHDCGASFRKAGSIVADIMGHGDEPLAYMRYYCGGPDGLVTEEVAKRMRRHGWTYEALVDRT